MRRRLQNSLLTLLIATTLTFTLIRQMPGDIVDQWAERIQIAQGIDYAQARDQVETMLNLHQDTSLISQYAQYLGGLAQGNLGVSLTYQIPVSSVILAALPWTALIAISSVLISFTLGCAVGFLAAWKRQSALPHLLRGYATVSQALPDFLVALLLLAVLAIKFPIFPMRGAYAMDVEAGWSPSFILSVLQHAALPIIAFALPMVADWALAAMATATSVKEELYLLSAETQGLTLSRILRSYLAPNALLPLIPNLAGSLAAVLGGVILVEAIFGYPGLGYFLSRAIALRDYPLIQGIFLLTTAITLLANLLGEAALRRLDPRIE